MRMLALALTAACVPGGGRFADDAGPRVPDSDGGASDGGAPGSGWTVAVFAGSGVKGAADGPPTQAQFDRPSGLALDAAGDLFVADTGNRAVRRIDPQGNVTTLVPYGPAGSAPRPWFLAPRGVAVDAAGNVYVADALGECVWRLAKDPTDFTSNGLEAFAGTCADRGNGILECGDSGPGAATGPTAATFGSPAGLALDDAASLLYVADARYDLVRFMPLSGAVLGTVAGNGDMAFWDGACGQNYCCGYQGGPPDCLPAQTAAFRSPSAVAVAPGGDVLVVDQGNCAIRRIAGPSSSACQVTTIAGTRCGSGAGALDGPEGVAAGADGVVYVSDTANHRVVAINPNLPSLTRLSELTAPGQLSQPWGIVADARGRLFVADSGDDVIRVLTPPAR